MQKVLGLDFLQLRKRASVFLTLKRANNTSPRRQQTRNPSPGPAAELLPTDESPCPLARIAAAIPLQRPVLEGTPSL